ncbi:MAG TPA: zinc metalloprotease HtpX [Nitrospiria bacterium]|nr:zinc metalloprotease HtpX [Nitrospiria bacterium]
MNVIKTGILLALLGGILVVVGGLIGGQQGAMIALIMAFAMNFLAYWFSDKMVLAMYRAKPVTEAEAPDLHRIVRNLARKAGIPVPKIYRIDTPTPNAFATGRNPEHAAVAVTTGIESILTVEELEGVLGHELSHVLHRDILISTIAATIAGAISYLTYMAQWAMMFGGGDRDREGNPLQLAGMILSIIVAPIAAMLVQMAISRSREYHADEGGAALTNPISLASALRKLEIGNRREPLEANPGTAHLFIVNPLRGGGIVNLFSTHPPIQDRIARLEAMAHQRLTR